MITQRKAANAMGGKTARACDSCLRKRARWYCAADDAFLCQVCDASVHSANQLASRHERVRLEGASSSCKLNNRNGANKEAAPVLWHQGFTKKARTPRPSNKARNERKLLNSNEPIVPEIGNEDDDQNLEEQLLYQVPVFDPCDLDDLNGFLPSDMDLAEFAADVENLLGGGLDDDIKGLDDLLDCKEENHETNVCFRDDRIVKVKDEEAPCHFDWNFDYESPLINEEEKAVQVPLANIDTSMMMMNNADQYCIGDGDREMKRNISLRLNYDDVITAWASQGCPWTTGTRPELNPNDCWPDCMDTCCKDVHHPYGGTTIGYHVGGSDGGREARVSRYREKRRTRLFSKKIRYEVRKLNAEKRPRMKGRFVKRTSFVGTSTTATAYPNYHTAQQK